MKLKQLLAAALMLCSAGAWAQESVPFLSEKNEFGGTAVSSLSTFRPSGTTYTLELTGCTAGTVIIVPGGSFSYTPTASGTVRFVRNGETVHVYEGTTYKGIVEVSAPADPTYPMGLTSASTENLIQNGGFEDTSAGTYTSGRYKPTHWTPYNKDKGTPDNGVSVRPGNELTGSYNMLMHNAGYYLTQKLQSGVMKNFTPYQISYNYIANASNQAGAKYRFQVGSEEFKSDYYNSSENNKGTTSVQTYTGTFTTPAEIVDQPYVQLYRTGYVSNTANQDLDRFDEFILVAANGGGIGITGATGATFLSGSAFAPEGVLAAAVEDGPVDATSWVKNPNFESNINDWNTPIGGGKLADNKQDQTRNFYESWNSNPKDGRMYQVIENLPSGTYELEMIAFADQAGTMNAANTTVAVYAQGQEVGTTSSSYIRPNYVNSVNFTSYKAYAYVDNTGKLEIGMRQYQPAKFRWLGMDNVTLKYVATDNKEEAKMLTLYQEKWNAVKAALSAGLVNEAYNNVTGDERTALSNAVSSSVEVSALADYKTMAEAAEEAYLAFIAAKTNYDLYVAEKANAERIDASITSEVSAPTTAAEAEAALKTILVNEYNYVKDNFNADAAATYGITIDQWTGTATSGGNADTPQTNSNEKWGSAATTYYEQGKNGWGSNAWTLNYTKTVTLPANTYVLKVAARASEGTTATLKATIGGTTITESLPNATAEGKGITTSGVASFDEGEFAKDGKGYGWQWRYLAFTLTEEGEVTLQIDASANSINQWCSFGDVAVVSNVTTDDMETAYNNFTMQTLGFEDGQYAPYNNVAVLEAYALAKAIVEGTTVPSTQAEVDAITKALTSPTWTANAYDVDAIYNGSFAEANGTNPKGWTRVGNGWGEQVTNIEGEATGWYYNQNAELDYGTTGVYTMPLAANQLYKLTFKYCSQAGTSNKGMAVKVLNADNEGMASFNFPASGGQHAWFTATAYFKTGKAGDYVLGFTNTGNTYWTGVSLVKAEASETVLGAMPANYTYYQELTLNHTFSSDNWNTLCVPFAFAKSYFAAVKVLSSVTANGENVNMTFVDAEETVAAGTPCLVKATNNGDGLSVENVALNPSTTAQTKTVGDATKVNFIGTFTGENLTSANSNAWVVSNNNLYNVDSDVTVGAYRAYFTVETSSAVKALNFNFGTATGIEAINGETVENGTIFNLAGQRVQKAQRGLYIVNGKKVLVK